MGLGHDSEVWGAAGKGERGECGKGCGGVLQPGEEPGEGQLGHSVSSELSPHHDRDRGLGPAP